MDEDGLEPDPPSDLQVVSDGALTVVAGADTSAMVLVNTFYLLITHPVEYARLRADVDANFPAGDEEGAFDFMKLSKMPFLNAVINEVLRLYPAVPSGSERIPVKGSGGKVVGEHFIPEGTSVIFPAYVMHRDPRYFSPFPDRFWPERWLQSGSTSDKGTLNTNAFIPFSYGPRNCVGKRLAIVEMQMVVALLVQRFDFSVAADYDLNKWEGAMEDWFVITVGELPVKLTPRY